MGRSSRLGYLLVTFVLFCTINQSQSEEDARNKTSERRVVKNERTVVFPVFNETGPSLPVFPDPIVTYVGWTRPVAPQVDTFGHPLCTNNPEDTFCEAVANYPDIEIRRAISYSSEEFKELFGTQTINPRKMAPGDSSEETVCPQQTRLFYPKAAVNENDQWAFVVNDVDYVQAVMAEMCEKEDKPCAYLDGALPSGVSSRCRQKFAYKRLLALHPNQKKTYTDAFRFPSCCVCYVKRPFILQRTRMFKVADRAERRTDTTRPDTARPDITRPDTARPDISRPEASSPKRIPVSKIDS